jgi:hypothetical protein
VDREKVAPLKTAAFVFTCRPEWGMFKPHLKGTRVLRGADFNIKLSLLYITRIFFVCKIFIFLQLMGFYKSDVVH